MRPFPALLSLTLAGASLGRVQPSAPLRTGSIDLTIGGGDETRDNYIFPSISGMVFDPTGRIVVSDFANSIRVYSPSGTFAYAVGRNGAGPGEYDVPIDIAFGPDGLLWVKDEGNKRFNAYTLGAERPTPTTSMRFDHQPPKQSRLSAIGFDGGGRVISMGSFRNEQKNASHWARFVIDRAGKVVRVDTIPEPPTDSIGDFQITRNSKTQPGSNTTWYYFQPYGATFLLVQSPSGLLARAVSSRYDIQLRDAKGTIVRSIRRDVQGPTLSAREQKLGQDQINGFLKRSSLTASELPHGLPDRKAPIRRMAFDQLERLWVERSVPDGNPREADVYDRTGNWVATMKWPNDVNILGLAIVPARGSQVLGVATDSLDVQRVVRLIFK